MPTPSTLPQPYGPLGAARSKVVHLIGTTPRPGGTQGASRGRDRPDGDIPDDVRPVVESIKVDAEPGNPGPGPGARVHLTRADAPGRGPVEQRLAGRPVRDVQPVPGWQRGKNESYIVEFEDGGKAIYMPVSGELDAMRAQLDMTGYQGEREVGMSRLDEELGFGLVPTTTWWDGPHGPGSLQAWHDDSVGYLTLDSYDLGEREQLGVLDHVAGSEDRRSDNIRTEPGVPEDPADPDGPWTRSRLVAIDNGLSFPERAFDVTARSGFVTQHPTRELSGDMVERLQAVDVDRLRQRLLDAGLPDRAVEDAVDRLAELRDTGRFPDDPERAKWW
jgi:hypothetical protein